MKKIVLATLLVAVLVTSACISFQRTPIPASIAQGKLLVDGKEFFVKGVTYSPVPVGTDPKEPKRTDVDWLERPEIYTNDFALMKRAGINTIRVLHSNGSVTATRKMLDVAEEYDIKVIIAYEGPLREDLSDPILREQIKSQVATMIRNYRDHPAVLMWMIGNEVNFWYPKDGDVKDWYTLLDEITRIVKKIDPDHPVATANNALSHMDHFVNFSPSVDVYATNMYSLTPGSWSWMYGQYRSYEVGKPFMISEIGADSWNSRANFDDEGMQATLIKNIIEENMNRPESIGIILFEWVDEWWKADNPYTQDGSNDWQPYSKENTVDDWASEEYFGIARQQPKSIERVPKYAYYVVQQYWGQNPVDSPPTLARVFLEEQNQKKFFVADVVTYGDASAYVSLDYRYLGSGWSHIELERKGDYYAGALDTDGTVPLLSYKITMLDEFGQKRVVEGTLIDR